ncbi:MAG: hypothetical protein GEU28_02525 [Dehalococcoidia bacterium]|nr:hypothetical protein [Dehalococcoidia bacterium]
MTLVSDLFALQQIDTDIESRRGSLQLFEAQLEEPDGLDDLRGQLQEVRERLRDLNVTEKDLELKDGEVTQHLSDMEKKLYSGSVRSPKELTDLDNDVKMLRRQRQALDERVLLLMDEVETARAEETSIHRDLTQQEDAWAQRRQQLTNERDATQQAIEQLEGKRREANAEIPSGALSQYEDMRSRRRPAIVALSRGVCGGCRVELPDHIVKAARLSRTLTNCGSCNRILYAL